MDHDGRTDHGMALTMTLPEDLAEELGEIVERTPASMGPDIVLSVVSALGPSVTIVTTALFSCEAFRLKLLHWCKHRRDQDPVCFIAKSPDIRVSIELDERTAGEMSEEISKFMAKLIAIQSGGANKSALKIP